MYVCSISARTNEHTSLTSWQCFDHVVVGTSSKFNNIDNLLGISVDRSPVASRDQRRFAEEEEGENRQ